MEEAGRQGCALHETGAGEGIRGRGRRGRMTLVAQRCGWRGRRGGGGRTIEIGRGGGGSKEGESGWGGDGGAVPTSTGGVIGGG